MIIFGLGNPGLRYRSTRHNAGGLFVDRFAKNRKRRFRFRQGYRVARVEIGNCEVMLIKPQCWMNQSGAPVSKIVQATNETFLIVVDDINLPLGKIRLKSKGSDGGHLGLRSITEHLGTSNFPRLRIGVGQPKVDVAEYVLSRFRRGEKRVLVAVIEQGIKGIEIMIRESFPKAQNHINAININDIN